MNNQQPSKAQLLEELAYLHQQVADLENGRDQLEHVLDFSPSLLCVAGMDGYYNKTQEVLASLFTNSDEIYYENITVYRKILNERLLDKEILNVFSEEMFTISYDSEDESLNILRNIERLKLLLEEHDVTILFSLRNQMDMFYAY